jgi:SAM-dependent methyltransferase
MMMARDDLVTERHGLEPSSEAGGGDVIPVFGRWIGSWRVRVERRVLSADALRSSYDAAAAGWSRRLERLGVPAWYKRFLDDVARADHAIEAPWILDCGIGTGALSAAYLESTPGPVSLFGVDISENMLAKARETLRPYAVEPTLHNGDVRRLPYHDGSFDLVLSGHVIEHLPDPVEALREMARVLRPGGRLVLCVTRRSLGGLFVQVFWRTHRVDGGEAHAWLKRAGFNGIESRPLGYLGIGCVARKPIEPKEI